MRHSAISSLLIQQYNPILRPAAAITFRFKAQPSSARSQTKRRASRSFGIIAAHILALRQPEPNRNGNSHRHLRLITTTRWIFEGMKLQQERLSNRRRCKTNEFGITSPPSRCPVDIIAIAGLPRSYRFLEAYRLALWNPSREIALFWQASRSSRDPRRTLRHALTRDHDGHPATTLGAALDLLCGE